MIHSLASRQLLVGMFFSVVSVCAVAEGTPVSIKGVNGALKDNIEAHLELKQGVMPYSTLGFPRSNEFILRKTRQALKAMGYYAPELLLAGDHQAWTLKVEPGQPTRWQLLEFSIEGAGKDFKPLVSLWKQRPFRQGDVVNHGDYESFKSKFQSTAIELGFFNAQFSVAQLLVNPDNQSANINWVLTTGPRYRIHSVELEGSELSPSFLTRFYSLQPGDFYNQSAILQTQQALNRSGFFSYVNVRQSVDHVEHQVDIVIELSDREKYELKSSVGYGTDSGPRFGISWQDRRVNDSGHNYIARLDLSEISSGVDFQYRIPLQQLGDEWINRASYRVKEEDIARSKITAFDSRWVDKKNDYWTFQYGATIAAEEISSNDIIENYLEYLVPSWQVDYYSVKDPFRVTKGWHWQSILRMSNERISDPDLDFVQWEQRIKWVYSLSDRWRLLWRLHMGITDMPVETFNAQMPTTYRFFAGGDTSVRGYEYQSLAPLDDQGQVLGGRYIVTQSVELDWQFTDSWRWALFSDAGNAFNHRDDYELKRSVGTGIRWVTPVGAIRFDVARRLDNANPQVNDKEWRWHITIGPDL